MPSWFERRLLQVGQEVDEAGSRQLPEPELRGGQRQEEEQAPPDLTYEPHTVPLWEPLPGVADIISCDSEHALVELCGRRLRLDLRFPATEIEPFFSGGCWAGSVVWTASLVLCDVIAKATNTANAAATADDGSTASSLPSQLLSVRGCRVLELGAGCGIPGLLAHLLGARTVLLTEQPTVASLLERTVEGHFARAVEDGRLGAASLDWAAIANHQSSFDSSFPAWCRRPENQPGAGATENGGAQENQPCAQQYVGKSQSCMVNTVLVGRRCSGVGCDTLQ